MGEFLNQYSFVIGFVILFVALAGFLPAKRWRIRIPVYLGAIALALIVYALLRPGDSSVSSAAEAEQVLASGQPVFVEFYSNTCAACLASKPFVNDLKGELDEQVTFMQLNVQDAASQPLMRRHGIFVTPTYLAFSSEGELVHRQSGILDRSDARDALLSRAIK